MYCWVMFEFLKNSRFIHYIQLENRGLFRQKIKVFFLKKIKVFFFANRPLQGFNPSTRVYWKIRELHQMLHLPRKVTLELHQILRLPYKRSYSLTNRFSNECNLLRISSQTNLNSCESVLKRIFSYESNLFPEHRLLI